jgi:CRP-like cAMP-binding protein
MGQLFCKNCCDGSVGAFRRPAIISPKGGGTTTEGEDFSSSWDDSTTSLKSSPSLTNLDPKRHIRIKNKKRSVALHAEFRDRQERGVLIAPPLVTERVMEDTDNLFIGQDLGVDTLHDGSMSRRPSEALDPVVASRESGSSWIDQPSGEGDEKGTNAVAATEVAVEGDNNNHSPDRPRKKSISFDKTPEENAFLDLALSDDDNFVFDGMSDRYRQKLKDSMERVLVPKNTFLIRKGDDPDYLYLILEGGVAVYIDPEEYIDENAVEIGKHALLDISVPANTLPPNSLMQTTKSSSMSYNEPTKREFKQSFVLQLRKSLFQSSYKENEVPTNIVGQFLSVVRHSLLGGGDESQTSILSGIMEEQASTGTGSEEEDFGGGGGGGDFFISMKELQGLKHERDLGPCDVFGELGTCSYIHSPQCS